VSIGKRRAIIDIGSNSIRLVVFGGPPRAPVALYNEKLSAGLGQAVISTGALDETAAKAALGALARFKALVDLMHVDSLQVAATAAVRDASNGAAFLNEVRAIGLPVELLSGDEEAVASGYGVISAIGNADGIAADLGGGSLELVRVKNGCVNERISLPLGILRVPEIRGRGTGKLARFVLRLIEDYPWLADAKNLPLYLVGGSWRSLARVHIHLTGFPLPVIANHSMLPGDARMLVEKMAGMDRAAFKQVPGLPSARIPFLSDAAALLAALSDALDPSQLVVCASGLREGLLFQSLDAEERQQDPLIAGAQFAADQQRRFPGYGEALALWLGGLFGDEGNELDRLRHAVCLLADLGWASNPDFRAIAGEELALHGNWVGVTARDRAIMAMALYGSFGGNGEAPVLLGQLATASDLVKAQNWGIAIRLAHRLGGGSAGAVMQCPIRIADETLVLHIDPALAALDNGSVQRRLGRLATALGLTSQTSSHQS
jgi:exopolyphosphatase / guanosine-5'-triphosphate,3'-diphosphate pyrophosphatase